MIAWWLAVVMAAAFSTSVSAHPFPFSYVDIRLDAARMDVTIVAHVFDLGHDLGIDPPENLLEPAAVVAERDAIASLLLSRFHVDVAGRAVPCSRQSEPEILKGRQSIALHLVCDAGTPVAGTIRVRAALFPYDPEHKTFLNIYEGSVLTAQHAFDRDHGAYDHETGRRQGPAAVLRAFIPAGIHHILIGPDHILFLVGLLLPGGTLRRLVVVVTAFTIAHSVTLSLATLDLVRAPAGVVEPVIALSIVFVGVSNLVARGRRDLRAGVAFLFGLVHGFGFAAVLQDMGLPPYALGWSLFGFNLGVEAGQLAVVFAVATILAAVRARSTMLERRVVLVGSVGVAIAGAVWFVQRLSA